MNPKREDSEVRERRPKMTIRKNFDPACSFRRLTLGFSLTKPAKKPEIPTEFLIATPNHSQKRVTHTKQTIGPVSNRYKFAFFRPAILAVDPGTLNPRNYDLASGRPAYDQRLSGASRNMN